MKTLRLLSFVAGFAFLFSGCSGPEGPQGPAGTNGSNGVANIAITVYDLNFASWIPNSGYFYYTFTDANINSTAETVTCFFSGTGNNGPWQAMPGNNVWNTTDQLTYSWNPANTSITFFYDYTSINANVPTDVFFNVAVIPPAVMKRHPNTNWKNNSEVMQLPEMQAAMHAAISKN